MNTLEGWSRAQLLLRTLREPPKKGSPREWILRAVLIRQDEIERAKLRVLAQVMLNKDKGIEAFNDYLEEAFPWLELAKKQVHSEQIERLMAEVKRGPMGIRPLWQTSMKSRLKAKHEQAALEQSPAELAKLYKKMGTVIPKS